ncbi:uncharacterized protein LOC144770265 [Lissotriton helveticus]
MFTSGLDMLLFQDCSRLLCFWFLLLCSCSQTGATSTLKVFQSPASISVPEGSSVTVTCVITIPGNPQGMNFKRRFRELMYLSETKELHSRLGNEFEERATVSGTATNTTITLHQLRRNDTDWYMCDSAVINRGPIKVFGGGTLLIVTDAQLARTSHQSCQLSYKWKWEYTLLISLALVILTLCAVITINKMGIKQRNQTLKRKRLHNTVYEDMSSSIRRNTMTRPHFYSDQNVPDTHLVENTTSANRIKETSPHTLQLPKPTHGKANMACGISPY